MSKRKLSDIETLIKDYTEEKLNLKQICDKYGLVEGSKSNVSKMLKKHGIKIRQDKGKNHHNWQGGITTVSSGYVGIWMPEHPKCNNVGYVKEHTLVAEKMLGRPLRKNEVVHHINMDKQNNDESNLFICDNKEHLKCHRSIENLIKPLLDKGIIEFKDGIYDFKQML